MGELQALATARSQPRDVTDGRRALGPAARGSTRHPEDDVPVGLSITNLVFRLAQ